MSETAQPKWTWSDYPIYGRGRGVIKDEGRSLSCGDVSFPGARRNDPVYVGAFDLIPRMCSDLNAAEEQRHATEPGSASEPQQCPACKGEGGLIQSRYGVDRYLTDTPAWRSTRRMCPDCHGTGHASTPPAHSEVEGLDEEQLVALAREVVAKSDATGMAPVTAEFASRWLALRSLSVQPSDVVRRAEDAERQRDSLLDLVLDGYDRSERAEERLHKARARIKALSVQPKEVEPLSVQPEVERLRVEVVNAAREFAEQFADQTNDEYAVAFDNLTNALSALDSQRTKPS